MANLKERFIKAYTYDYGVTKKRAYDVYKDCIKNKNFEYIKEICGEYYSQTKKMFYND